MSHRIKQTVFMSYRSEVRLAAVVSCGHVSDVDDLDAAALLRVRTFAVKVPDVAEDLLDGGWVVTHDVGGFRHVITIPGDRNNAHNCQNKREEETSTLVLSQG